MLARWVVGGLLFFMLETRGVVGGGDEGERRLYGARGERRRPAVWVTGAAAEGDGWADRTPEPR